MELPRFFAVSSGRRYLCYINGDDDKGVKLRGLLKFSGEEVLSHLTKFEAEKAEGGKVHIKSCYNNKYWQRLSEESSLIVAGAIEKEEDTSKWSCTLFNLKTFVDRGFRFIHVQLGQSVIYSITGSASYDYCLRTDYNNNFYFSIIDWATLVMLPKHVAFKGENHKYAKALPLKNQRYVQFSADKITSDQTVEHEIFYNASGSIRIKNHCKQFWKRNHHQDWITIDAAEDSSINDKDTLFSPILIDNNVIVLHNEGNTKLCNVVTTKELTNCLSAANPDPTFHSSPRLEVVDLVRSCRILQVDYHLMDEKIYDQTILTVASADAVNSTEKAVDMDVKLSYTDVMTWSMSSNLSSKLGYKVEVTASIPKIADANAKITGNFSGDYSWGKTVEMKSRMEVVYPARVPPMTKVEVKLVARKGSCDIPFSYKQENTLRNRSTVIDNMQDGIYTCSNCFNFNYETSEEPYDEDEE